MHGEHLSISLAPTRCGMRAPRPARAASPFFFFFLIKCNIKLVAAATVARLVADYNYIL